MTQHNTCICTCGFSYTNDLQFLLLIERLKRPLYVRPRKMVHRFQINHRSIKQAELTRHTQ